MTAYQLQDTDADDSNDQESLAHALSAARNLLPGLMQRLKLRDGVSRSNGSVILLEPGQYLQLQIGEHCVRATIDQDTHNWAFQLQPSASGASPQLCFARSSLPVGAASSHGPRGAGLSPPPTGKRFRNAHQVAFNVRVWCGEGGLEHPVLVVGTCPDDVNAPSDVNRSGVSAEKASWQLWVQCQGQYVTTVVGGLALVEGTGVTLQAVAHVPPSLLARHHMPDGPTARLQLLAAELWAGDVLLSSTPLLVDGMQHLQPAPAAAPSWFGWWGAPCVKTAASLIQEMTTLSEQLQVRETYVQVNQLHADD